MRLERHARSSRRNPRSTREWHAFEGAREIVLPLGGRSARFSSTRGPLASLLPLGSSRRAAAADLRRPEAFEEFVRCACVVDRSGARARPRATRRGRGRGVSLRGPCREGGGGEGCRREARGADGPATEVARSMLGVARRVCLACAAMRGGVGAAASARSAAFGEAIERMRSKRSAGRPRMTDEEESEKGKKRDMSRGGWVGGSSRWGGERGGGCFLSSSRTWSRVWLQLSCAWPFFLVIFPALCMLVWSFVWGVANGGLL